LGRGASEGLDPSSDRARFIRHKGGKVLGIIRVLPVKNSKTHFGISGLLIVRLVTITNIRKRRSQSGERVYPLRKRWCSYRQGGIAVEAVRMSFMDLKKKVAKSINVFNKHEMERPY